MYITLSSVTDQLTALGECLTCMQAQAHMQPQAKSLFKKKQWKCFLCES